MLFKDVASFKHKGDPVYRKGVWVGKSSWSDSHICLTRSGAVEARSIRRLPEQFDGQMLVHCRGLPWQYSVQGILMKTKFAAKQRVADMAEDAVGDEQVEKEAKTVGEQVAVGMYGHAFGPTTPGFLAEGQAKTPAGTPAPPTPGNKPRGNKTPGTKTPMIVPVPATPAAAPPPAAAVPVRSSESSSKALDPRSLHRLPLGEVDESPKRKIVRLPIPEAMRGEPAGNFPPGAHEASPKGQRMEEVVGSLAPVTPPLLGKREYSLPWDKEDDEKRRMSPKRRVRSIQEEFPGGDEMIAEEALQHQLNAVSDEEEEIDTNKGKTPVIDDEELARLDAEACKHEEARLEAMGVLEKMKDDEEAEEGSYVLISKMVITWKHRDEQGGWFRRARLVGRQFKWSVFTEDAFAPTSASVVVRMLLQLQMRTGLALYTLDVKDAFLLMDQPEDERAMIVTENAQYKLRMNLPGQRNAAAQWFKGFCKVAKEYGLVQDVMQPTMMKMVQDDDNPDDGRLYLTIHVDDLLLVGNEKVAEGFIKFMEDKGWKTEKRGPLRSGSFSYLKRQMEIIEKGITIRPDQQHIKDLAKLTKVDQKKFRSTPGDGNFNKLSKEDEPMNPEDITKYRSAVGKLLYIAPDRPDIQYVAQGLASLMSCSTKKGWRAMQHVSSYLLGTMNEGILFEHGAKGRCVLNTDDNIYEWNIDQENKSILEVICDADYAGQRDSRKSVSSVQIFLNGCLVESYVRSQRSIALPSGESEYVAMVGGCSEGIFIRHCWKFLTNEGADMVCRSDSSAARALAGRIGVGRTRHIAAGLLWLQQRVNSKEVRITGIPTAVNTSDIVTKILSKARMNGLKYLIKMIDGDDEKIGKAQYDEIKLKEELKKNTIKMAKAMGANAKVALVIALSLLQGGQGTEVQEAEEESQPDESWWVRPLVTMLCLSMIGALSLARLAVDGIRAWLNGRRTYEEDIEEKQDEWQQHSQAGEPHVRSEEMVTPPQGESWQEEDQEKVNMQWQIVRLEVVVAEQEEKIEEIKKDRDFQHREVVRMYNMCNDLRFELENLKEERARTTMKMTGSSGTEDDHVAEMEKMAEDCARAWEAVELWKKKAKEVMIQANEVVREKLGSVRFTLERKEWWVTRTGGCYHTHDCSHLSRTSNVKTIKPCAQCIPAAIGGVSNLSGIPVNP